MQRKRIRDAIARVDHHSNSAVSNGSVFPTVFILYGLLTAGPCT